jgi:cobalt transporter subunit CbtA
MIKRVLLAALLAGIAAGMLLGIFTQLRLAPMVVQAETFETADAGHSTGHSHAADSHAHSHGDGTASDAWAPSDGMERAVFTILTSTIVGAGFAAVLTGLAFLLGLPLNRKTGLLWGLSGFAAVALAPAAGLPPELPGMPAASLGARQAWWALTIVCTAASLWLVTQRRELWAIPAALILVVAPHLIGAPQPSSHETAVSAGLAQAFVANSLAVNGLFWATLGIALGFALDHFEKDTSI